MMVFLSEKTKTAIIFKILILIITKEVLSILFKRIEFNSMDNFNFIKIKNLSSILNINIKKNTILIFENNNYHYECTPGYSKYFIDIGYNVHIIMKSNNQDTFYLFEPIKKINIFIYNKLEEIMVISKKLKLLFNKYNFILVQSTDEWRKELYEKLGFFKMNNSIFVLHNINYAKNLGILKYYNQKRLWSLGNFKNALQVNPHYFGNIKIKDKKNKVRFFITSTKGRNYNKLISVAYKLKKKHLEFEILVTGYSRVFSSKNIPKNLKKNFVFKYKVSYYELYQLVQSCDYILIILDPKNKKDHIFKKFQATGSIQLAYGFSKPTLINKYFAHMYGMNSKNSFIYENSNFYNVMYNAIILNKRIYKKKQNKLIKLSNNIYKKSIKNIKQTLNSIKRLKRLKYN